MFHFRGVLSRPCKMVIENLLSLLVLALLAGVWRSVCSFLREWHSMKSCLVHVGDPYNKSLQARHQWVAFPPPTSNIQPKFWLLLKSEFRKILGNSLTNHHFWGKSQPPAWRWEPPPWRWKRMESARFPPQRFRSHLTEKMGWNKMPKTRIMRTLEVKLRIEIIAPELWMIQIPYLKIVFLVKTHCFHRFSTSRV